VRHIAHGDGGVLLWVGVFVVRDGRGGSGEGKRKRKIGRGSKAGRRECGCGSERRRA
jgi:hypothetical protein